MTTTLALDFGLKLGWCVGANASTVKHGMKKLGETSRQSHGYRFVNFESFLVEVIEKYDVRRGVFESVRRHQGVDAAHTYGGLLSVMKLVFLKRGIQFEAPEVKSIKKDFCGKGNALKEDMIRECATRGFMGISDDNESDAVAIWCVDFEKRTGIKAVRSKVDAWS